MKWKISGAGLLKLAAASLFLGGRAAGWWAFHSVKVESVVMPELLRSVRTAVLSEDLGSRSYRAAVRGAREMELSFPVSGQMTLPPAEEGARVKAGALLAVLDQHDLVPRASELQRELNEAQYGVHRAQSAFDRSRELLSQRIITPLKSHRYRDDLVKAQDYLKSVQTALRTVKESLKATELRAPFDGIVTRRYIRSPQRVRRFQPVLSLHDPTVLEVVFEAPDLDVARFADPRFWDYTVSFSARPGKLFALKFKSFGALADPETGLYPVTMEILDPESWIVPGMTCVVNVRASDRRDQNQRPVQVPLGAVVRGQKDQGWLWRCEGDRVRRVPMTIRSVRGDVALVVGDFRWGDRIVTGGVHYLTDGQKVRILE